MSKIVKLENLVCKLYEDKNPNRADWSDWLYENHVFIVADFAEDLAKRFGAPVDSCRAGAVLHDIADVTMSRFEPAHEEESLKIARKLMNESGFSDEEIHIVVDDAIKLHSCHDGVRPATLVGKILASADALAHLNTNFYTYTTENLMPEKSVAERNLWAAKKIPRDFYDKIAFDDVREETKPNFEKLSAQFAV